MPRRKGSPMGMGRLKIYGGDLRKRRALPAAAVGLAAALLEGAAFLGLLLGLGLFDQADQRLDLAQRFGATPHQHPVHMPVAALERAVLQVVDRLPEDQGAGGERAVNESLAADVDRLVREGLV